MDVNNLLSNSFLFPSLRPLIPILEKFPQLCQSSCWSCKANWLGKVKRSTFPLFLFFFLFFIFFLFFFSSFFIFFSLFYFFFPGYFICVQFSRVGHHAISEAVLLVFKYKLFQREERHFPLEKYQLNYLCLRVDPDHSNSISCKLFAQKCHCDLLKNM